MLTALVVALALSAPEPKPATAELKWKFSKGDEFFVSTRVEDWGKATGGSNTGQSFGSIMEFVYKVAVTSADEKGTTLEVGLLSCKSNLGLGIARLEDEKVGVGKSMTFTLDAAHKVTKVDGQVDAGRLSKVFSPEYVRGRVQDLVRAVPGKALAKGDTWKGEAELPLSAGFVTKRADSGTVVGREEGLTKLGVESDITLCDEAKGGATLNQKGDKGKRTVLFDAKSGRVRKVDESYTVVRVIKSGGGTLQDTTLTTTVTTTVSVSDSEPKADK